jgi:SulP family sulfate permease
LKDTEIYRPKIIDSFKGYTRSQLLKDSTAGVIVGIVALPLAIAFAIASGLSPEKGLFTAIIAGFIISAFGGSRVQIGGPTGAFIVVVYGIVQDYGASGLIIATFLAGIMLVVMGFAKFGSIIKYIPHPLIVGFTTGIAVIIFTSQIKDLLGLEMGAVPADFVQKWAAYFAAISTINIFSLGIGLGSILIIVFAPRISRVIPGSLIAILVSTVVVQVFDLPVATIGSRYGSIPATLPSPIMPDLDWATIKAMISPAFTIALLAGIESLLSAVVADGMTGGNHRSNTELIAQGGANIASAIFGGMPATGAIARTATNVRSGGRTPVAGIVHAVTLLVIMLTVGKWAALIPLSCLAGILVVVAYHMSEHVTFLQIARGSRSDAAVLLVTFFLTVLFDLTIAIEVGMVLAVFLFMRTMIKISNANYLLEQPDDNGADSTAQSKFADLPSEIQVFELSGPLFFGAAYKFKDAMRAMQGNAKVLIVMMHNVPVIDATGIHTLEHVFHKCRQVHTQLILCGVQPPVSAELRKSRLLFKIGKRYVVQDFSTAVSLGKAVAYPQRAAAAKAG